MGKKQLPLLKENFQNKEKEPVDVEKKILEERKKIEEFKKNCSENNG